MQQFSSFLVKYVCNCIFSLPPTAGLPLGVLNLAKIKPYQRGFFCSDGSIKYPFHDSTVTSTVLYTVGFTLPICSVSSLMSGQLCGGNVLYMLRVLLCDQSKKCLRLSNLADNILTRNKNIYSIIGHLSLKVTTLYPGVYRNIQIIRLHSYKVAEFCLSLSQVSRRYC